jgi:Tfp pilus assembly protein FimT
MEKKKEKMPEIKPTCQLQFTLVELLMVVAVIEMMVAIVK